MDAGSDRAWHQEAGATVFAPFPADTDSLAGDQAVMRVHDPEGLPIELWEAPS